MAWGLSQAISRHSRSAFPYHFRRPAQLRARAEMCRSETRLDRIAKKRDGSNPFRTRPRVETVSDGLASFARPIAKGNGKSINRFQPSRRRDEPFRILPARANAMPWQASVLPAVATKAAVRPSRANEPTRLTLDLRAGRERAVQPNQRGLRRAACDGAGRPDDHEAVRAPPAPHRRRGS